MLRHVQVLHFREKKFTQYLHCVVSHTIRVPTRVSSESVKVPTKPLSCIQRIFYLKNIIIWLHALKLFRRPFVNFGFTTHWTHAVDRIVLWFLGLILPFRLIGHKLQTTMIITQKITYALPVETFILIKHWTILKKDVYWWLLTTFENILDAWMMIGVSLWAQILSLFEMACSFADRARRSAKQ